MKALLTLQSRVLKLAPNPGYKEMSGPNCLVCLWSGIPRRFQTIPLIRRMEKTFMFLIPKCISEWFEVRPATRHYKKFMTFTPVASFDENNQVIVKMQDKKSKTTVCDGFVVDMKNLDADICKRSFALGVGVGAEGNMTMLSKMRRSEMKAAIKSMEVIHQSSRRAEARKAKTGSLAEAAIGDAQHSKMMAKHAGVIIPEAATA